MSAEWKFIFFVLIFYGFLFTIFSISNGELAEYGFDLEEITFATPSEPTGNVISDFLTGTSVFLTNLFSFFFVFFISSFGTGMSWLGFINWALMGTAIYLFLRMIRGGG